MTCAQLPEINGYHMPTLCVYIQDALVNMLINQRDTHVYTRIRHMYVVICIHTLQACDR